MAVTIDKEFELFRPALEAFAAEFGGDMSFVPGDKARKGNGVEGHGGDWLWIEWTPKKGRTYFSRVVNNPALPDAVDVEAGLNEARALFRYNEERHAKGLS